MAALSRFTFDLDLADRPTMSRNIVADLPPEPVGIAEDVVERLVREAREEGYAEDSWLAKRTPPRWPPRQLPQLPARWQPMPPP